jgi:hypothetical protein
MTTTCVNNISVVNERDRKIKRFTEKHLKVLKDMYEICDNRLEWDDFILWVYLNTPDEIKNDIRSFRPRDRRIAF